jgi:exosortase A
MRPDTGERTAMPEDSRLSAAPIALRPPDAHPAWTGALVALVLVLAWVLVLYRDAAVGMVSIWARSETFTHGFVVAPLTLWLIWRRRAELAVIAPRPAFGVLALVALVGVAWLLGELATVNAVTQFALVALLVLATWAVLGTSVVRQLAFPLGFLFFAVPIGSFLLPTLMEWTADFTVAALQLTGVPVYREGQHFSIPTGNWSVVEACSGVRYLIASLMIGTVYAYLSYRSTARRLAFVGVSIVVPIVANWVRAYLIVMLGHLSGNRIAVGVDHLIYGWVFFGVVMALMFWIGARWREDDEPPPVDPRAGSASIALPGAGLHRVGAAALATLVVVAAWPAWAAYLDHRAEADTRGVILAPPQDAGGWRRQPDQATEWRPRYSGATASVFETYEKDGQKVVLYLAVYRNQKPGAEMITSTNIMVVQKHPVWSNVGASRRAETVGNGTQPLRRTLLRSARQRLVVWDWFVVSGQDLVNPYRGKLLQARDRVLGRGDDGVAIIVAAPYEDSPAEAETVLREFVAAMRGSIDASVAKAFGQ